MIARLLTAAGLTVLLLAWTTTPTADGSVPDASTPPSGAWVGGDAFACPSVDVLDHAGKRPVKLAAGCSVPSPGYWRSVPAETDMAARIAALQAEIDVVRMDNNRLRQQLLMGADAMHDCGTYIDLARLQCPPCDCHEWLSAGAACAACAGLSAGATAIAISAN